MFFFSRGSASSSQKLSSREPISTNCYFVLIACPLNVSWKIQPVWALHMN